MGYGVLRSIIEIYRGDSDRGTVGPLSTSQFIGAVSLVAAGLLLFSLFKKYKADPTALRLWERPLPVSAEPSPTRSGRRKRKRH
jgi:prolipoprotein diacylglyceryltransferase